MEWFCCRVFNNSGFTLVGGSLRVVTRVTNFWCSKIIPYEKAV